MVVVDLAGRPRFFIEANIGLASLPHFRFIRISVMGVGLGEADGLAIGGAVLTEADVIVGFSRLFL